MKDLLRLLIGGLLLQFRLTSSNQPFPGELQPPRMSLTTQETGRENKDLKHIWIVPVGTRGDIQPYIAVALALKNLGYHVTVFTSAVYLPYLDQLGLEAVRLYDDPSRIMREQPGLIESMKSGNPLRVFWKFQQVLTRLAPGVVELLQHYFHTHPVDLVITSSYGEYLGWYVSLVYKVPYINICNFSVIYNQSHMQFGYPALPYGLHYYMLQNVLIPLIRLLFRGYEDVTKAGIMKRFTSYQFARSILHPVRPLIFMLSPSWKDILAPDASPLHKFVGTTVLDADLQTDDVNLFGDQQTIQSLKKFLEGGSKPVYIGWGSMITSPTSMAEVAVEAAQYAKKRAIVLGGYADVGMDALMSGGKTELIAYARANVLFVKSVPHEWLFPRVACTIHHGGAGTTTAAMRGGVPTIVTPVLFDQFDNSYLIREIGVGMGFEKHLVRISGRELGSAILKVTSDQKTLDRAKATGETLRQEDGAVEAARQVELFWEEFCRNGEFFEIFPDKLLHPLCPRWLLATLFALGMLIMQRTRGFHQRRQGRKRRKAA